MPRLDWGGSGNRFYEAGVDRGVLYIADQPGVPWIGLTNVEETPTGGEPKSYYIDGVKYLQISSSEEFAANISAFTYPDEFSECDGTARVRPGLLLTQQRRQQFGFSYRVRVGNDLEGTDHAYKIHLVYNALAAPAQRSYATLGGDPEATTFSWSLSTKAPSAVGYKHSAHVVIDTRDVHPTTLKAVEDILYGDETNTARLPSFEELVAVFDIPVLLEVTDLGGGLFRIEGPDDMFDQVDIDSFVITGDTVVELDPNTYSISSE